MKNKTLCVDGNYLLKQSFHGNQHTYDDKFGYVGALQTFFMIIRKMIKENDITKVIVFWDGLNGGRLRYKIYPYYKSNRNKSWNDTELVITEADKRKMEFLQKQKNEDAFTLMQKLRIQRYCEELFFRQYEFEDIEADDAIAYYCKHFKKQDEEVIIYTNDGDLLMLIEYDDVQVYLAGKGKKMLVNKHNFNVLYYDYTHKNIALLKAIEGCSSDMIHGVQSIKQATLFKHFPELKSEVVTIDYLLTKAKEINDNRKKPLVALTNLIEGKTTVKLENVLNGKHLFDLNYKLVNLLEPSTFMTDEAIEELEMYTTWAIDPEGRGGKNIIKLMMEDGFIKLIPRGAEGYVDFLRQFLTVVNSEKKLANES